MTYSAILPYIQQMSGGDAKQADALAKHLANNQVSSKAILNIVQMSQEQEAKAKDQRALQDAIAVSQKAGGGGTDWSSVLSSYIELGGSDVAGVSKLAEEQTSKRYFEPIKRDLGDGIIVVQTGPNTSQVVKTPSGDAELPAGVQIKQYDAKRLEEAMQAYHQGDDAKVNRIFLEIDVISKITGKPLNPLDVFGKRESLPEPKVPSLQDSDEGEQPKTSLDDLVSKYQ